MIRPRSLFLASALCIAAQLPAQLPTVDVTLVPLMDGNYEVRLRPDLDFDGLFAAIVFTLRWEAGSSTTFSFDESQELSDIGMSINPSGAAVDEGPYRYRAYAGFGGVPFFANGYAWTGDQEFVLGQFTLTNGPADVRIVNDAWTDENNGDYFISLNGSDQTGSIYETSTSIEGLDLAVMHVSPNPASNSARVDVLWPVTETVQMEAVDLQGRSVPLRVTQLLEGRNSIVVEADGLADGVYDLRLRGPSGQLSVRWVIQR